MHPSALTTTTQARTQLDHLSVHLVKLRHVALPLTVTRPWRWTAVASSLLHTPGHRSTDEGDEVKVNSAGVTLTNHDGGATEKGDAKVRQMPSLEVHTLLALLARHSTHGSSLLQGLGGALPWVHNLSPHTQMSPSDPESENSGGGARPPLCFDSVRCGGVSTSSTSSA